jgi:hypothetical protein
LVDVANALSLSRIARPNPPLLASRLDEAVASMTAALADLSPPGVVDFRVRLYDGWFDEDGKETPIIEMIAPHVRSEYPRRSGRQRVFVELAGATLALPSTRLIHTYRRGRGFGRYPITVVEGRPRGCAEPASCSLEDLRSWVRRGKCPRNPTCAVPAENVASFQHQKLVDAMIVADAVWAAANSSVVAIFSDDEDVIPGLLTAASYESRVVWLTRGGRPRPQYALALKLAKVECREC